MGRQSQTYAEVNKSHPLKIFSCVIFLGRKEQLQMKDSSASTYSRDMNMKSDLGRPYDARFPFTNLSVALKSKN